MQRINADKEQLSASLSNLYAQGIKLQQSLKKDTSKQSVLLIEKKILLNNKAIDFIQAQLGLLSLSKQWLDAEFTLQKKPNMSSLEATTEIYRNGIAALIKHEDNLKQQLKVLNSISKRFDNNEIKVQWQKLVENIQTKIREVGLQEQTLEEDLATQQEALSKQLSMRTHLPDLKPSSWLHISKQIILIPVKFFNYVKQLFLRVFDNYIWQDWIFKLLFYLPLL